MKHLGMEWYLPATSENMNKDAASRSILGKGSGDAHTLAMSGRGCLFNEDPYDLTRCCWRRRGGVESLSRPQRDA